MLKKAFALINFVDKSKSGIYNISKQRDSVFLEIPAGRLRRGLKARLGRVVDRERSCEIDILIWKVGAMFAPMRVAPRAF